MQRVDVSVLNSTPCECEGPVYRKLLLTVLDSLRIRGFRVQGLFEGTTNRTPTRVTQIQIQKHYYLQILSLLDQVMSYQIKDDSLQNWCWVSFSGMQSDIWCNVSNVL